MAFLFSTRDENTRTCWNYTFQLTHEHPTEEDLAPLKLSYDKLADAALARLNELAPAPEPKGIPGAADFKTTEPIPEKTETAGAPPEPPPPAGKPPPEWKGLYPPKRDLYVLLRDNAAADPVLSELWTEVTTVPEWVDWEQIGRGQDVFYRYGGACITGLAFQSLLGGLGAPRVVETLTRTGGFAGPVIRHRLLETTQHILQVTASISALRPPPPSGPASADPLAHTGFASSVRVRLLHAAVRSRVRALAAADPGYYATARLGEPISDLDSAGTALTFSATLLFLSLPRQGIFPSGRECADYVALWRYVAHVLGAPTWPLGSAATARRWMEALLLHEIAPSHTSRVLAANMVAGLAGQPPARPSRAFIAAQARWLNGDALCDRLGLPRPPLRYKLLVAGQCAFFVALAAAARAAPALDRANIRRVRALFWDLVVVRRELGALGAEAAFDFKYVPRPGKLTTRSRGPRAHGHTAVGGSERRGAYGLAGAVVVLAAAAYALCAVLARLVA